MRYLAAGLAFLALTLSALANAGEPVRVLADRTESLLKPLFETFTKMTGIPVEAVYMDKGLIDRVAGNPTEADVLITKDAELMEIARSKGLLQSHNSDLIRREIDKRFQGPGASYFVDAYRARLIFYAKARVKPEELSTYADRLPRSGRASSASVPATTTTTSPCSARCRWLTGRRRPGRSSRACTTTWRGSPRATTGNRPR